MEQTRRWDDISTSTQVVSETLNFTQIAWSLSLWNSQKFVTFCIRWKTELESQTFNNTSFTNVNFIEKHTRNGFANLWQIRGVLTDFGEHSWNFTKCWWFSYLVKQNFEDSQTLSIGAGGGQIVFIFSYSMIFAVWGSARSQIAVPAGTHRAKL